ncbi:MAG: hypothetical protein K2X38_14215 [Gemmataceae bacterium]|nr:hypothetical protein [Gemmataceae bacterium]
MNDRVSILASQLSKAQLFSLVGEHEKISSREDVSYVTSWSAAKRHCSSELNVEVQLECRNVLTMAVAAHDKARWKGFRDVWKEIELELAATLSVASDRLVEVGAASSAVLDWVRGDFICACLEAEYADIVAPRYFNDRARWYIAGYFPCGWEGDFPKGRLLVY